MPGVFAAGDVRHGSVHRVASAVGAGAIAIQSIHEHFVKAKLGLDNPLPSARASAHAGANPPDAERDETRGSNPGG